MNDIEPWCISRQIWWGHRIPAWYDEKNIFVAENEKDAKLLARSKFKKKKVKLIQETRCIRHMVFIWFMAFCNTWDGLIKRKNFPNFILPQFLLQVLI